MEGLKLKPWPRVNGIYLSEDGRIFSEIGITFRKVTAKGSDTRYGHYAACCISNSELGKNKSVFIHRIVCETFHPKLESDSLEVNHIDGNKLNNHPSNLEWATKSQNRKHAYDTGLNSRRKKFGENNVSAKLDESQVTVIRSLRLDFSQKKLAKYFGVSQSNIGNILNGKTWTHI